MSATISFDDFGGDIADSIKPIANILGLIDDNGDLDVNGWNLDKAMGCISTYEKTDLILDVLSTFLGLPKQFHRQTIYSDGTASGLLYSEIDGNSQDYTNEEWFRIYGTDSSGLNWSVYLTVIHTMGQGFGSDGSHFHNLRLGLGFSFEREFGTSPDQFEGHVSIPLFDISTSTVDSNGEPVYETDFLLWTDESSLTDVEKSGMRPSILARINQPSGTRYSAPSMTHPSCSAVRLQGAIGNGLQVLANGVSSSKLVLTLEDYMVDNTSSPSGMIIDSWSDAGGVIGNVIDGLIPALLNNLPDGRLKEDLLPMLGLLPSDEYVADSQPTWPEWPSLNVLDIASYVVGNDIPQLIQYLQGKLSELMDGEIPKYWLKHLVRLVSGDFPSTIDGTGTRSDPWVALFGDANLPLSLSILISKHADSNNVTWVDVGVKADMSPDISGVDFVASLESRLCSVPLSQGPAVAILPSVEVSAMIQPESWAPGTKLVDLQAGGNGNPLSNLSLEIERGRAALRMDEYRDFTFALELLQVDVGTPPNATHWDVLDLTSADTPLDLFNALAGAIMDMISEYFSTGDLLQWVGSLLGICSPRGNMTSSFALEWYGVPSGSDDLRIDINEVISDPLKALMQYHLKLLDTSSTIDVGGTDYPAWSFIFEAIGNIFKSSILGIDDFVPPAETDPPPSGTGVENDPWMYSITPDGDPPGISLTCWADSASLRIVMGVELLLAMVYISEQIQMTAKISSTIMDVELSSTSNTVDNIEWLPSAGARLALENHLQLVGTAPYRLELEPLAGIHAGIQSVCAEVTWSRVAGMAWDFSIVEPGLYVIYPDWDSPATGSQPGGLFTQIDAGTLSWDDLNSFYWDGVKIRLDDNSCIYPTIDFTASFTLPTIDIPKFDGSGDFTLSFSGFSLGVPWFGAVGTYDPNFGIGSNGTHFNIQMPSINLTNPLASPHVIGLLGRLIAYKMGKFGMFLSGFFRMHADFPSIDLPLHLKSIGSEFKLPPAQIPSNIPKIWQRSGGLDGWGLGLYPYHLPLDWPSVDWSNLIPDPWQTIKSFMLDVFGGVSRSGEPFAFPAMRMIWGLFSKNLPDLRKPDLGWSTGMGTSIEYPDVPFEIVGDGSYKNPFSVPLTPLGFQAIEFIFWLDPDGLPSVKALDMAKDSIEPQLRDMLENGIDSVKTASMRDEDWTYDLARLLIRMSYVSPRIEGAIRGLSEPEIQQGLLVLNDFMQQSDGLVPMGSQTASSLNWANFSTVEIAMHWTALETPNVITKAADFVQQNMTPQTVFLLIQAPWNDGDSWDTFLTQSGGDLGITGPASHFDLTAADTPGVSLASINLSPVTQAQVYTLKLSTHWPENGDEVADQIAQIELCIQHILSMESTGTKVAIIGHSVGGLAAARYTSSGGGSSSEVVCTSTICTPHSGFTLTEEKESQLRNITHILELVGFGGRSPINQSLVANTLGQSANRADVEETITMLTQNREGGGI